MTELATTAHGYEKGDTLTINGELYRVVKIHDQQTLKWRSRPFMTIWQDVRLFGTAVAIGLLYCRIAELVERRFPNWVSVW